MPEQLVEVDFARKGGAVETSAHGLGGVDRRLPHPPPPGFRRAGTFSASPATTCWRSTAMMEQSKLRLIGSTREDLGRLRGRRLRPH